jgi:hypothetical protein
MNCGFTHQVESVQASRHARVGHTRLALHSAALRRLRHARCIVKCAGRAKTRPCGLRHRRCGADHGIPGSPLWRFRMRGCLAYRMLGVGVAGNARGRPTASDAGAMRCGVCAMRHISRRAGATRGRGRGWGSLLWVGAVPVLRSTLATAVDALKIAHTALTPRRRHDTRRRHDDASRTASSHCAGAGNPPTCSD